MKYESLSFRSWNTLLMASILTFCPASPTHAELCPKARRSVGRVPSNQTKTVTLEDLLPKYFCYEKTQATDQVPELVRDRMPASPWETLFTVQSEHPLGEKPDPIVTSAHTLDQLVSQSLQLSSPAGDIHRLRLEMRSLESKAKIDYSGLIQARVTYLFYASDVIFEMFQPINARLEVVYLHIDSGSRKTTSDQISLRWALP